MSGAEVLQAIRQTSNVRVVMISGYSETDVRQSSAAAAQLDGFLEKPFKVSDLLATVTSALAARASEDLSTAE
jgi:CheY-like chemotaxis protein